MNMAKKITNDDNFKKYQERLAELNNTIDQQTILSASSDLPSGQLINDLIKDGNLLLESETKSIRKSKVQSKEKNPDTIDVASKNPYIRARIMVLNKMPAFKRKEIEEMEKTGNIENDKYKQFVKEVSNIGDTL